MALNGLLLTYYTLKMGGIKTSNYSLFYCSNSMTVMTVTTRILKRSNQLHLAPITNTSILTLRFFMPDPAAQPIMSKHSRFI